MKPEKLLNEIQNIGIDFFCGVPDSLLKEFCLLLDTNSSYNNYITPNEGSSIALGSGHYLATGKPACIYLQNSGLGNTINPLVSLASKDVYNIPMLLVIGWRGEPGFNDEPQHNLQGKITRNLLKLLDIKFFEITNKLTSNQLNRVFLEISTRLSNLERVALLIGKNVFSPSDISMKKNLSKKTLSREQAIKVILDNIDTKSPIISTTGKTSRELYELCLKYSLNVNRAFLTVGSMGHASMIALGVSMSKKNRTVYLLDGDGAAIMHLGSLAMIGQIKSPNYVHILLNNYAHESVGGMSTSGVDIDFTLIAKSCGYKETYSVKNESELSLALKKIKNNGPYFIHVDLNLNSRNDLSRPSTKPEFNKLKFMEALR